MFKCINKQDTKYAELLVNARPGGHYDPSAPKKSNLEKGVYELHLFIEQTRGLINPGDAGDSLNPVIQVHAFDQKRHSKTKKNTGTAMTYWGQHLYFIKKFDNESELETQKLKLEIFDDKMIGSDALIGDFELDIMNIYHSENHLISHKWLALSNFEKGLSEIKGYVMISANVITSGDEALELTDYQPSEDPDSEPKVLMPPHLTTKPWQMKISLVRAEGLIKMDLIGSIDCYLLFQFAGASLKTDYIKDNINPIWGKNIFIPFSEPSTDDCLTIKIYDYDSMQSDELVGVCSLKKSNILEGKHQDFFWLNIYGSQPDGEKEACNKMNQFSNLGSMWKGRVLLSAVVYENEKPKLTTEKLDPMTLMTQTTKSFVKEWIIIAEVLYGEGYPDNKEKYGIEVRWANQEINFSSVSTTKGLWEWYERKKIFCHFPYPTEETLPDIFIYLKNDSKRLCFIRKKANELLNNLDQEPGFCNFLISKEKFPDLTDDKAGYVKLRITLGSKEDYQNLNVGNWNAPLLKPMKSESVLYIHLYNAKNLIPADDEGTSDPYIVASFNGVEIKSETLKFTLNPVWNASLTMRVPISTIKDAPPITIKMFDWDQFGRDDLIGTSYINLNEAYHNETLFLNKNVIPTPKWYPLKYSSDTEGGKVLLGFNLFVGNYSKNLPSLLPPYEKYNIKIKALGVRGLQKTGVYSIKKPLISINVDSIRDANSKVNLPEKNYMVAEAKSYGPDANFSTILNFSIDLPKDSLLWPNLNCLVKNCVWKDEIEPLLGTFAIDLSEAGEKTKTDVALKLSKREAKSPGRSGLIKKASFDVSSMLMKSSNNITPLNKQPILNIIKPTIEIFKTEQSNVIQIDTAKNLNKKQSSKIFAVQDPKYIEFVDELELQEKSQPKDAINSSNKINKTNNLNVNSNFLNPGNNNNLLKRPSLQVPSRSPSSLAIDVDPIVIKAQYIKEANSAYAIEKEIPDFKKYYPLGYDPPKNRLDPTKTKKQYRLFLESILESSIYMDKNPFDEYIITRGNRAKNKSIMSKIMGLDEEPRAMGIFKCFVEVLNEKDKYVLENSKNKALINLFEKDSVNEKLSTNNKIKKKLDLDKEFMTSNNVVIRVHILEVFNLVQLDCDSIPNPYIKVELGNQVKTNEKEYRKEVSAAEFYSTFELNTSLPGSCLLQIQVMDHHDLSSDVIIGETLIDLENRWFSKKWRRLKEKPIETRDIYSPICSVPTGRIRVMVEIIPASDKEALKNVLSIAPKQAEEFELRCVVWEIDGCAITDYTDTSDYFVTGSLGDVTQKTDVHWQAQKGFGSFNWRMVFPIMLPTQNASITFQVWDKDLIGSDDYISAITMDFAKEARDAFENDISVKMFGKQNVTLFGKVTDKVGNLASNIGDKVKGSVGVGGSPTDGKTAPKKETKLAEGEKFDLDLINAAKDGMELKKEGKMTISFELVPPKMAKANPVGKGRSEPNASPYCPEPKGRLKFSLNPFEMLEQLFGPKMRAKMCLAICTIICCILIVSMIPMIASNISTNILTSWL